jgi:ComF family protein
MIMSGFQNFFSAVQNVSARLAMLTGKRCSICGAVIEETGREIIVCRDCSGQLRPRKGGFCGMCARIYALENRSVHLCFDCRNISRPWRGISFFSVYQGLLKEIILKYKFRGDLGLGNVLADLLFKAARSHPLESLDFLIPVPLHPLRLRQRGFNQSLELSRILGQKTDLRVLRDTLVKTAHTPPQSSLERRQRLKSLKKVFEVSGDGLKDKRILLVDDIMTTGSTLDGCARALIRAGASEVRIVFLARAV